MDSQHTHARPFRFTDPRQQRIHDRLSLLGPGPVDFYRAACRLMAMHPPLEATTHLVGHLLRELESALRAVVRVVAEYTEQPRPRGEPDKHKRDILAILKGLGIAETDAIAHAWLGIAGQEKSDGLAARAHRDALNAPRPVDTSFRTCWDDMECILDVVLAKFETRFLHSISRLDALLSIPFPSLHDAEKLRNQVPNNLVTLGYFFEKLTNAAWLQPLRDTHFFRHPPDPHHDHDQGLVSFPLWPASRYLVRMAAVAEVQETVLDTAIQIGDTENTRVYEDLAEIALALPATLGVQLVPQIQRGLASPYHSLLPQKLGALISHLAKGGQGGAALDVARALFMVLSEPHAGGASYPLLLEPRASWSHAAV